MSDSKPLVTDHRCVPEIKSLQKLVYVIFSYKHSLLLTAVTKYFTCIRNLPTSAFLATACSIMGGHFFKHLAARAAERQIMYLLLKQEMVAVYQKRYKITNRQFNPGKISASQALTVRGHQEVKSAFKLW
jgi:hypothetical protein